MLKSDALALSSGVGNIEKADGVRALGIPSPNRLSRSDRHDLVFLLKLLKTHLQSAVESSLVPGTKTPMLEDSGNVFRDRIDIRLASYWIKRLRVPRHKPVRAATPGRRKTKTAHTQGKGS